MKIITLSLLLLASLVCQAQKNDIVQRDWFQHGIYSFGISNSIYLVLDRTVEMKEWQKIVISNGLTLSVGLYREINGKEFGKRDMAFNIIGVAASTLVVSLPVDKIFSRDRKSKLYGKKY